MLSGKVSITFDAWTSNAFDPYMAITAHYIESHPDLLMDWTMKKDLIAFTPIVGNHSGQNQAQLIIKCIEHFGLEQKVGIILIYYNLLI